MLSRENNDKWKKLAAEQGYKGRCTWCWRFYAKVLPKHLFQQCNDCGGGDVVFVGTGEPTFDDPGENDREPWPQKGTKLYDLFREEQDGT